MNKDEEMINLDELDTDLSENEYEDEGDDFEEEEPQVFMNVIVALGVIIALVAIICIVFLFFKSGKEQEENYVGTVETEQEISTEEQTISGNMDSEAIIESETIAIVTDEEVKMDEIEAENAVKENITIQDNSSSIEETSQSAEANVQETLISGNESMEFTEISDTVTAKDVTNLRSVPNTLDEGNIVSQLMNGEAVSRNGILYNAERICKSPYRAKYIRRGINSKMPAS